MSKISNISGFPEWLPEQKLVEDQVLGTIKRIYESHGFTPLETPSVELLSTLTAQGVEDKEIYLLQRRSSEEEQEAELGMHFDLTVPFARYVAQHFNDIVFPFRRYQCQRSWRGERPQRGRFREFYQFDADIVGRESLPLACDAETLTLLDKVFSELGIAEHVLYVNNRKLLSGIYEGLGMQEEQRKRTITAVDKLDKIGREGVLRELQTVVGLSEEVAGRVLDLTGIRVAAGEVEQMLSDLGIVNEQTELGGAELVETFRILEEERAARVFVDLSLARGLGYYSGLIVEARLPGYPEFGSVGGGGRYEGLVSRFLNKKVPGVGVSVGVTRLMDLIFRNDLIPCEKKTPAQVLVTVLNETHRKRCNALADRMRAEGLNVEVFHASPKLGKQIDYAAKKSIPVVAFLDEHGDAVQVKDLRSGVQSSVDDLAAWCRTIRS